MKKAFLIFIVVAILFLIIVFGFRACQNSDQYRDAFIEANVEYGCFLKNNPGIENNSAVLESQLTEIYKENGLPVEDDQLMRGILDLYEGDSSILNLIQERVATC